MSTLIATGAVVTGEQVLRPGWVEVEGDRILAVGCGAPLRPADRDLPDAVLVPGFVDMHSHGGGGAAFTQATPEAVETATAFHRRHGTTRMMASLVSASPTELRRQVEGLRPLVEDGRIIGIHLEGPWMSPARLGAHDLATLRDPDPAEIASLLTLARGTIAMVTLAPELPGGIDAVRRFAGNGVVVGVGHTDADYDTTCAAIDAGARVATHLFNAMRGVHHREPGPVVALLADPRVTIEMIADGIHLHPAAYAHAVREAGPGRVALVTDAMSAAGMCDGHYLLGELDVDVVDGIAHVAGTETIAGSTATMDQLFRFSVAHGGLLDCDAALLGAVRQTSTIPARTLGIPAAGITPGAAADLVVLDPALQVADVMAGGSWVDLAA